MTGMLLPVLDSCLGIFCVDGNGTSVTEERLLDSYTGISNETSLDVFYEKGDAYSLFIEADENLLQYIKTSVNSGVLEIDIKGTTCIRPSRQAVAYITTPELESLYLSGSGDMISDTLSGGRVDFVNTGSGNIICDFVYANDTDLRISGSGDIAINNTESDDMLIKSSGSGDIEINGTTNKLDVNLSGSGQVYADELEAGIADILISGSGNLSITVTDELYAVLTGSGNLYYYGSPSVTKTISGSGNLIRLKK